MAAISESLSPAPGGAERDKCNTPEEATERAEREAAGALLALDAMLDMVPPQRTAGESGGEVRSPDAITSLIESGGFWKKHLIAKSPLVRSASYRLVRPQTKGSLLLHDSVDITLDADVMWMPCLPVRAFTQRNTILVSSQDRR